MIGSFVISLTCYRKVYEQIKPPPYAETQAYVEKVQALHQRYRQVLGALDMIPTAETLVQLTVELCL